MLNTGTYPVLVVAINEVNLLVFELVITNRGEASIAKNWELCLVHDGKPIRFNPAKIPPEGIPVSATERITPDKSLVDNAIRVPIEHAHTAGGWVVFKVSDTALIDGWKNGKEPFKGSSSSKTISIISLHLISIWIALARYWTHTFPARLDKRIDK